MTLSRARFATPLAVSLLASVTYATGAQAQDRPVMSPAPAPAPAASEQGNGLDIIVTAQKRSESLSDVPMSVTALSGDMLLQRGVQDVQDLTKFTPGLSYVESGASSPVYSLRGVGFFDSTIGARPAVSVYVDEVPLTFSIDLERVEVLKGPQGTLFGQNSTGGAINYIAAKPTSTFRAGADASYSSFNTVDLQGFVSGPVTDTLGVRVAGRVLRGDEWQRDYLRHDSLGDRNLVQGRVIVDWTPTRAVRLSLNLNGFRDRSDTQAGQLIAFLPSSPASASKIPDLINYPKAPENDRAADWDPGVALNKNNRFYQASLRGDIDLAERITLTSITAYSRFDIDQVTDQDGTALNNVTTHGGGFDDSFSQEVRVAAQLGGVHLLVGGNYAADRAIERNLVDLAYSTTNFVASPFGQVLATGQAFDQSFDTKAAFGTLDWDVSSTVRLHGGLRYTDAKLDYHGCTQTANAGGAAALTSLYNVLRAGRGLPALPTLGVGACLMLDANLTPGEARGTLDQDNVSWRAGIDWKPAPHTLIYANVSRGYKAGSAPTINGLAIAQVVPAVQESVLAYEVGTKLTVLNGAADFSAAAFYYDYDDKQVRGRTLAEPALLGPLETLVNIPKSRSVAGTYLDSKVTKSFVNYSILGDLQDFKGNAFPYTPKYQLVADGQYSWSISRQLNAMIGGNVNYRSATVAGFGSSALLDIQAYTLVDARIGVSDKSGKWRAQLFGRNIFNQYYWTNTVKYLDNVRRYAGMPATFGMSLSYRN
jgi:iron complex outermembrane recepter protein